MVNRDQILQKVHNQIEVLRLIRREGRVSQTALSALTGYQPSTVSNLVRELKTRGLVRIAGKGESGQSGGKRTELLSLSGDHGVFSGIHIRPDGIVIGTTDFCGELIGLEEEKLPGKSEASLLGLLSEKITACMEAAGARYHGTGIAVSSVVDNAGNITVSSDFNLEVHRFREKLEAMVPAHPLVIENDANCAALYSYYFFGGSYRNLLTFLLYPSRPALGSGIILEGKLFRGAHGGAGELIWTADPGAFAPEFLASHAAQAASLLDCEAVVLSGEMITEADRDYFQSLVTRIGAAGGRFALGIIPDRNIAVTGAAFLSTQVYIERLLKGEGGNT